MQWHRICITIPKGNKGGIDRNEKWAKGRQEPRMATLNPVTLTFHVKGLRWPCAFSFSASNIHLLLRLVLLHARSSPGQISHSSDTTNILGIGFILATSCNGLSGPAGTPLTHTAWALWKHKKEESTTPSLLHLSCP